MASSDLLITAALAGTALGAAPWLSERMRPVRRGDPDALVVGGLGYRTHYRWLGPEDGPVAICIHGLTTPSFVWDAFAPVLAQHGYRVLLYDLYGRGLSDVPPGVQTGTYFADQLDRLLDALHVKTPTLLLGYSMGGAIAAHYAATRPHRVAKLVLIAPAGFGHDLGLVARLSTRLPVLGGALMRVAYPATTRRALEADRDMPCAVENMIERQIEEIHWRGFAPAVWSSIRGVLSEDLAPCHRRISELGLPTLVIWGEEDDVIPLSGMARLQTWNPGAQNQVIAKAGHALPYTHIREFAKACAGLLS